MTVRIWAFVQTKGGSGKSTLATNIAVQAEAAGKPVLLVDLDAQSSATLWGQQRGDKRPTVFEGRPEKLAEIIRSAATLGVQQIIIDSPEQSGCGAALRHPGGRSRRLSRHGRSVPSRRPSGHGTDDRDGG